MNDDTRLVALRDALRLLAEANRRSETADTDDEREAASRERDALEKVALAVTAAGADESDA